MTDSISPSYYNNLSITPIEVIEAWELDFCLGNALKYISRAGKKNTNSEREDLLKAIWYLNRKVDQIDK